MFVIYHTNTTALLEDPDTGKRSFETHRAALAGRTRILKKMHARAERDSFYKAPGITDDFAIAEGSVYQESIEKTEMVRNIMTGKMVEQSVNTPRCCSVSSESYFSM